VGLTLLNSFAVFTRHAVADGVESSRGYNPG